jgi:GNAT superfamily N-acetyltransferase
MSVPYLRPASADEAPELLEVMNAALAHEVSAGAIVHLYPDVHSEAAWLRYVLTTGSGWVAEADGAVVGFGISAWRGGMHWLVSLYVRPEAQHKGVGRQLLSQIWPRESGADRATLVDAASRPAMRLYLNAGLMPAMPVLAFAGAMEADEGLARGLVALDDREAVAELVNQGDASVFGAARPGDHAHWTAAGFAFRSLWTSDGGWIGYGRWSPSGRLGPVVLADGADWPAALAALAADASRAGIERLRLMVPAANESALRWCQGLRLTYQGMEIAMATRMPGAWNRCLIHRAALP